MAKNKRNKNSNNNNSNNNNNLQLTSKKMPIANSYKVKNKRNKVTNTSRGQRVSGQQQVLELQNSGQYETTQLRVNPGLPLFQWLRKISNNYDKYVFHKLSFTYVPVQAVTTTPGQIYLAVDYDPSDSSPESLADLSTFETYSNGPVYDTVEIHPLKKRMFDGVQHKKVRCGPVGGDLQLYDACSITIATYGGLYSNDIGQLWVSYDVEFFSQQTNAKVSEPTNFSLFYSNSAQNFNQNVYELLDMDVSAVNGLRLENQAGQIFLPCGRYLIMANFNFTIVDPGFDDGVHLRLFQDGNQTIYTQSWRPRNLDPSQSATNTISIFGYFKSEVDSMLEVKILHSTNVGGSLLVAATHTGSVSIQAL
jgi:hypothetical protein